jgi:hypothetical protein
MSRCPGRVGLGLAAAEATSVFPSLRGRATSGDQEGSHPLDGVKELWPAG